MFDKSELKNIALSKTIKYEEENLDDNEIKLFKSHLNLEKGVDYRKLLYVSHVKKKVYNFYKYKSLYDLCQILLFREMKISDADLKQRNFDDDLRTNKTKKIVRKHWEIVWRKKYDY